MISEIYKPFLGTKDTSEAQKCHCGKWDDFPTVNSYCRKWSRSLPVFCFLEGGAASKDCPGARKIKGKDIYFTSDASICNASNGRFYFISISHLSFYIKLLQNEILELKSKEV